MVSATICHVNFRKLAVPVPVIGPLATETPERWDIDVVEPLIYTLALDVRRGICKGSCLAWIMCLDAQAAGCEMRLAFDSVGSGRSCTVRTEFLVWPSQWHGVLLHCHC